MLCFIRAGLATLVLMCLFACSPAGDKANKTNRVLPPTPVTIAQAEMRDIPIQVRQIGSVEPVGDVKAQINGELNQVFFKEGEEVKKGQELFEIDPRPYQQALDQSQAAVQKDVALVSQAEANLARDRAQAANAKQQAKRYAGLAEEGVISKDQTTPIRPPPRCKTKPFVPIKPRSTAPRHPSSPTKPPLKPPSSICRTAIFARPLTAAPVVFSFRRET